MKEYRYKGKTYKVLEGEWDAPLMCSDGRKIYPYEDEAIEVMTEGTVILDDDVDID